MAETGGRIVSIFNRLIKSQSSLEVGYRALLESLFPFLIDL